MYFQENPLNCSKQKGYLWLSLYLCSRVVFLFFRKKHILQSFRWPHNRIVHPRKKLRCWDYSHRTHSEERNRAIYLSCTNTKLYLMRTFAEEWHIDFHLPERKAESLFAKHLFSDQILMMRRIVQPDIRTEFAKLSVFAQKSVFFDTGCSHRCKETAKGRYWGLWKYVLTYTGGGVASVHRKDSQAWQLASVGLQNEVSVKTVFVLLHGYQRQEALPILCAGIDFPVHLSHMQYLHIRFPEKHHPALLWSQQ